jgi:8-oxo-dGTP pyrophosphatase MutT (NUDIX family)
VERPQAALDSEEIVFKGNVFSVARQYWRLGNGKVIEREIARRSPGVRMLVRDKGKILIIREFRLEHNGWDYRLPGGKVFDTLGEYEKALVERKDMLVLASEAAKRELLEETGLSAKSVDYLCKARAGEIGRASCRERVS